MCFQQKLTEISLPFPPDADGSSEGGNTARSDESKSRRSSYYTGDDPLSARGSRSNPQGKSQVRLGFP